jgi:hypothetical protein
MKPHEPKTYGENKREKEEEKQMAVNNQIEKKKRQ